MANWFSDTWREITSGGKARTETYNRREPEPRRTSSRTTTRSTAAPREQYLKPQVRSGGGGGGGGRVSASRTAVPEPDFQQARETWSRPQGLGRTAQAREDGDRVLRGAEEAVSAAQRLVEAPRRAEQAEALQSVNPPQTLADVQRAQRMTLAERVEAQQPRLRRPDGSVVLSPQQREQAAREAGAAKPAAPREQYLTRELTDEEYLALTPRQRAAVQYNTGLVNARDTDRAAGNTDASTSFLTSLGLEADGSLDDYLRLDRAVGDAVLARLDDPTAVQQSTEARRWARGVPGAAAQSEEFAQARSAADTAASAMAAAFGRGYTGLGQVQASGSVADALAGGAAANRAGFGTAPRDVVIQQAFDAMIASDANFTPEQVANGIANMNDANGTDVDPQEVWDFAALRLDAADAAALAGENFVLPVTDATIVPLSAADIRARYGI